MSACYRSNHPDVLAVWEESDRLYREAHERICTFAEKYGGKALVYTGRSYSLAGLDSPEAPGGNNTLWRLVRKTGAWVPRRTTKQGKELGKEFDACAARSLGEVPGLPRYVNVVDTMFHMKGALLFAHDGYVYAGWMGIDHEDVLKSSWGRLDESAWAQIQRSEFYAAQEAEEEKRTNA